MFKISVKYLRKFIKILSSFKSKTKYAMKTSTTNIMVFELLLKNLRPSLLNKFLIPQFTIILKEEDIPNV